MSEEDVKTEVTTIAEQEEKSGKQLITNNAQDRLAQSIQMYPIALNALEKTLKGMKAKQMSKAVIGAFDLPKKGVKVPWVEKNGTVKPENAQLNHAFGLMVRLLHERTIIDSYMAAAEASKAMKKKQEELDKKTKEQEENSEENNESSKEKESNNGNLD